MDDDLPRYYANWVTPHPGAFDLALNFGYNRQLGEEDPAPEWMASIVLAWEEAVVLRDILSTQIALYEKHLGQVRKWEGKPPPIDAESNGNPEPEGE
jgi:hypothetical protein